MEVLILGGTREARSLAAELAGQHFNVLTSLAGRVSNPALPVGEVRIGGFGGVSGLSEFLTKNQVPLVVDATHPFAKQITENAAQACAATGVPLLRLQRPSWRTRPDAAGWQWVADTAAAAALLGGLGQRPFISSGRQTLPEYLGWTGFALVRVVEPLTFAVPDSWRVLLARGPFDVESERRLFAENRIDLLVTKDSGGALTEAKLLVAAQLGVPVVAIERPEVPKGVSVVESVAAAVAWVVGQFH